MKVTIDTNILFQDYNLTSPHFKVFLDNLDTVPATLHISAVVIDEVINKYKETLNKSISEIEKSESKLRKTLGLDFNSSVPEVNKTVRLYEKRLLKSLKAYNVEILKYPETPHNEIVKRIFERKLPFKGGEKGYRDFLIWESIRTLVLWGHEQVIFLTNNTTDFGSGKNISEEYKGKFNKPENFRIITSVAKFNEEYIYPKLKKLEDIKDRLQKSQIDNFDVKDWINNRLIDLMRDLDLEDVLMGFPEGAGDVYPTEIIEIHEIDIKSVRELKKGEKLIHLDVGLKVGISVTVDWDDFLKYEEVRDYLGDENEEFAYTMGNSSEDLLISSYIVVDHNNKIISEEIAMINGPYTNYEIDY